jgi:flagellar protein FlaG
MEISAVGSTEMPNNMSTQKGTTQGGEAIDSTKKLNAPPLEEVNERSKTLQNGVDKEEPNQEELKKLIENMQSDLDSMNINLEYFLYGAHDNRVAVRVVNKETGKVIREIPAKEIQALQEKMSELIGMIFNKEA